MKNSEISMPSSIYKERCVEKGKNDRAALIKKDLLKKKKTLNWTMEEGEGCVRNVMREVFVCGAIAARQLVMYTVRSGELLYVCWFVC
jgi:hypothetical protein